MLKINELRNPSRFLEGFLEEYLLRGLGSMQKRDVEILFVHLLMADKMYGEEIDYYELSHVLCLSEPRVKRLIYDAQLRYKSYTEEMAKEDFIDLMKSGSFYIDKYKRINFMIRKPMLMQYFEEWVARFSGLIDTSFNKSFVKVSVDDLSEVLEGLMKNPEVMETIKGHLDEAKEGDAVSSHIKSFLKKFFLDKVEETSGHSLEYAGLILKQLILGF